MVISPIIIIIAAAILIAAVLLYIINKPKNPLFTGIFLFMLLCCVIFTFAINIELSSSNRVLSADNSFSKVLTSFITMESSPSKSLLYDSFSVFKIIDLSLVAICVIAFIIEMRILLKNNIPKEQELKKWLYMTK